MLTYAEMMQRYAAVAGLRPRLLLPVGVLSPPLSSHWAGLVGTPGRSRGPCAAAWTGRLAGQDCGAADAIRTICAQATRSTPGGRGDRAGHLLRLGAEMKLPGLAWLELSVGERAGQTVYRQRALFHSRGLAGHLYWRALLPLHAIVFGGMARNITRAASTPGRSPSVRR